MTTFQVGDEVHAKATLFDTNGDNSWSRAQFGDQWNSAKCKGFVTKVFKSVKKACVKWEIDGKITKIDLNYLEKNADNAADADNAANVDNVANTDNDAGKFEFLILLLVRS